MDLQNILSKVDHTLLSVTATESDIFNVCEDALNYKTASVCIPPCYVDFANKNFGQALNVCTVIGFPNGYNSAKTKMFETSDAIENGANEIDMVINIGALKNKNFDYVESEIKSIKKLCGEHILKVIIETCLLTDEEKITMCKIVSNAGADYIKTSTGFSTGGAILSDIKLFSQNISTNVKIKAAGGISNFEDAQEFITAGASRLGTSRLVKLAKQIER